MSLVIQGLTKTFSIGKDPVVVLKDINLTVCEGEFLTIVGHSGCGKSTLLKIIAGLVPYETGHVSWQRQPILGPGNDRGMVFQEHRLLPWLTVADNVGFGLRHLDRASRQQRIDEHIQLVKLDGFAAAYPHQLSGGMAQRAAIARGLVNSPKILLLDEPFGALDALTRIQMQKEILRIWQAERNTMILVTHDIDEAIYLGQRTVVMSARPGEIKAIIDVNTELAKDRGSTDFARLKKQILRHFFTDEEQIVDFAI